MTEKQASYPAILLGLILSLVINFIFAVIFLLSIPVIKEILENDKIVASISTSEEDMEFIEQVCRDLGINNEITIIAGPYYIHNFFSGSKNYHLGLMLSKYPIVVDPTDPTKRILMDGSIYVQLTAEERKGILAHEISHINSLVKGEQVFGFNISREIEANRFATKYVSPDTLVNLYRKYGGQDVRTIILIEDLERQKS